MIVSRIKMCAFKTPLLALIYFILTLQSCIAKQNQDGMNETIKAKINNWQDSISRLNPRNKPLYIGFDISMGGPSYRIATDIAKISDLRVAYLGGMIGGVIANPVGKVKAGIGLYYSGDNVPYSFEALAANATVSLYLLRLHQVKYHTVEPYLLAGISQTKNKFYGSYMSGAQKINYSTSDEPYIGSVNASQILIGSGFEFQLENHSGDFIHLFAELSYGTAMGKTVSTDTLGGTSISNSVWITVGVNFGKFK